MTSATIGPMETAAAVPYWDSFASNFANLGPPLRPAQTEIRLMEEIIVEWAAVHGREKVDALLLGATPEIAAMRWPEKSLLMGVDCSLPMARQVWPGNIVGRRNMVCANWLAMPRKPSSCDIVVGDGSINCLNYPQDFRMLGEIVSGLLRDHGLLILRCYLQSRPRERPEAVYADALRGSISSFHAFKLRLLMALQPNAMQGVAVNDVYRHWVNRNIDPNKLPKAPGWRREAIETIQYYRDAPTVYAFPTLAELRSVLRRYFDEVSLLTASHDLADRCPVFVFRVRGESSHSV